MSDKHQTNIPTWLGRILLGYVPEKEFLERIAKRPHYTYQISDIITSEGQLHDDVFLVAVKGAGSSYPILFRNGMLFTSGEFIVFKSVSIVGGGKFEPSKSETAWFVCQSVECMNYFLNTESTSPEPAVLNGAERVRSFRLLKERVDKNGFVLARPKVVIGNMKGLELLNASITGKPSTPTVRPLTRPLTPSYSRSTSIPTAKRPPLSPLPSLPPTQQRKPATPILNPTPKLHPITPAAPRPHTPPPLPPSPLRPFSDIGTQTDPIVPTTILKQDGCDEYKRDISRLLQDLKNEQAELDRWKRKWMEVEKDRVKIQEMYDGQKRNLIERKVLEELMEELRNIEVQFDTLKAENSKLKEEITKRVDSTSKLETAEKELIKLKPLALEHDDCVEHLNLLYEENANLKKQLEKCIDERNFLQSDVKTIGDLKQLLADHEKEYVRLKNIEEEFTKYKLQQNLKSSKEQVTQTTTTAIATRHYKRPDIDAPFGGEEFL